jgi:hypothetical protein
MKVSDITFLSNSIYELKKGSSDYKPGNKNVVKLRFSGIITGSIS